jgi:hypothetical protein
MCIETAPSVEVPKYLLATTLVDYYHSFGIMTNTVSTSANLLSDDIELAKANIARAEESIRNISETANGVYIDILDLEARYPSLEEPGNAILVSAVTEAVNYVVGKIGELREQVKILQEKLKIAIDMGTAALSDKNSYTIRNVPQQVLTTPMPTELLAFKQGLVRVFKETHPIAEAQMKEDVRSKVDPKPIINALMDHVQANVNLDYINVLSDTLVRPNLNLSLDNYKC